LPEDGAVTFAELMEHVAQGFELLGVLVLAAGTLWSFAAAGLAWRRAEQSGTVYAVLRKLLGGSLLLGLEILVAADLVKTIAVAPTVQNVLTLGLIVLIRTFLSLSLEIEITGSPPWRRGLASGAELIARARDAAPAAKPPDRPGADQGKS
jgi:uncharacterized membrane protein